MNRPFLLALIAGAAASYAVTHWRDNAKIVALQAHADSVAATANRSDSLARIAHDSALAAIAKLDQIERTAEAQERAAQKRVAVFHAALHVMVDSNVVMKAALDSLEQAHAGEVTALEQAKAATDAKVLILSAENASLLRTVAALDGQVQDLNRRIQALNHKTLPKWLDTGLKVVKTGLAIKGGIDLARGR
jgi:hypothetical protein